MSRRRVRTATPVKMSVIILAFILLLGVLDMAYGFFQNNSQATYLGIFITGVSSWVILMTVIIIPAAKRNSKKEA